MKIRADMILSSVKDLEVDGRRAFKRGKGYRVVMAFDDGEYICMEGDLGYVNVCKSEFYKYFASTVYAVSWMGLQ